MSKGESNETRATSAEHRRLAEHRRRDAHWRRWGPYLAERQWGTVREDYSHDGEAWDSLTHDQARYRAYRWGEDGLLGISDNHQRLCLALALWNGRDAILKERLFGLTGPEGNHGEDVKEYYYYLDSTPTHSYLKALYKYPQGAFPYERLIAENAARGRTDPEFELLDTGVFADERYFDVYAEYAKATAEDILVRVKVVNRGPDTAELTVLPTVWFRNTWAGGETPEKPELVEVAGQLGGVRTIRADHPTLGPRWLYCEAPADLLFTENETNRARLRGEQVGDPGAKDAFHDHIVAGRNDAVSAEPRGTKAAAVHRLELAPDEETVLRLRLSDAGDVADPFGAEFEREFSARIAEADAFYATVNPHRSDPELSAVQRQAFAGMLWTKQYYRYVVQEWLKGEPGGQAASRQNPRNRDWDHLHSEDILSMPDKWEYPWFAVWDTAFHTIPLALVDPDFAKRQLELFTREWYMHPNGQIPAYEWDFGDVNPPVHAWAAWRVYKIEKKLTGRADRDFLERVFQKLLLNFTWWVNRKDVDGNNVFQGGFLGLDNIGVFNRSEQLPTAGHLEQSDSTSWMGMYCLNMLAIALELARDNRNYEDIASKFFEHFLYIANAINHLGGDEDGLWNELDGFFYDIIHTPDSRYLPLKIRSMVGIIPLFAVQTLEEEDLERLPGFRRRMEWFIANRPDLSRNVASLERCGVGQRRLLSIVNPERLNRILTRVLDPEEFLADHGVRSLSRFHRDHPYVFNVNGDEYRVDYEAAESESPLFGGNSNWRGPIWFPLNFLLIESLQKFHHYFGDTFTVDYPTGSGESRDLWAVASDLSQRLVSIFVPDAHGRRPVYGGVETFQGAPAWRDLILFHEYFNGDDGAGLGASHQTGWTGLVAKLIQQRCEHGSEDGGAGSAC